MAHISNIYDYRNADAIHHYYNNDYKSNDYWERWYKSIPLEVDFASHVEWAKKFRIGRPKATKSMTTERLEELGLIGLYDTPTEEPFEHEL